MILAVGIIARSSSRPSDLAERAIDTAETGSLLEAAGIGGKTLSVVQGSTKTHTVLNGTSGDDIFIVPAAFTTVNGDGGSDVVQAFAEYNLLNFGTLGDDAAGLESLRLSGQGNRVTGGDTGFSIVDTTGGLNTLSLGNGANNVQLAGSGNAVTVGGGQNNITFSSGQNRVEVNSLNLSAASSLNVVLSGTGNTVGSFYPGSPGHSGITPEVASAVISGGSGGSVLSVFGTVAHIVTGGFYNALDVASDLAEISPGSGHDTVRVDGFPGTSEFGTRFIGNYTIHLKGVDNVVSGIAGQLTVDGGDGSNTFILEIPNDNYDSYRYFTPPLINTITVGGANNSFALRDVDSNTIVTGTAQASVTIYSINVGPQNPFDLDAPGPTYPGSVITFAGMFNALHDQGHAGNTITGGSGEGTFVLGSGNSTLTTGGSQNKVTAGAGSDTITPGSDHAIVTLNGTNARLIFQGDGNAVFLNAGASGSINGVSPNLHVTIAPGIGAEVINGLAADLHAVLALTGGAGGYTNTAQIKAALVSDGGGGTLLTVGAGSLDFAGVAPSSIAASMFVIRS